MERISQIEKNLTSSSFLNHLSLAPADPILGTALAYKADKNPKKMNLGVGAYRDDNEKPFVFKVIKEVEQILAQ